MPDTPGTPSRILVVEDEDVLRGMYCSILACQEPKGAYEAVGAPSAEQALELLQREAFDVVLTDFRLAGRDGIALIREVRKRHPRTVCLLISGFLDTQMARSALDAGALAFLKKPCRIDEILSAVEMALASRAMPDGGARLMAERVASVLEANVFEALFIAPDYEIRAVNGALRQGYGDCAGSKCYDVLGTGGGVCAGCKALAAADGHVALSFTRPGRSANGEPRELEERIEPWYGDDGRLVGIVVSLAPAPAEREPARFGPAVAAGAMAEAAAPAEAERQRLSRLVEFANGVSLEDRLSRIERMQSLGQLSAGIAHQINNYSVALSGFTEIVAEHLSGRRPLKEATAAEFIRHVQNANLRIAELTRHLMAFAKSEKLPAPVAGDVSAVARNVLALAQSRAKTKRVLIESRLADNLPPALMSPVQLEQAVLNIVMNAIDATPPDRGRIEVTTFRENGRDGGRVCIAVKDNGCGIPAGVLPRIFDAFVTTKPGEEGTGLGLSVARSVVAALNGAIDVQSAEGQGTTMTIRLPEAQRSAAAPGQEASGAVTGLWTRPPTRATAVGARRL